MKTVIAIVLGFLTPPCAAWAQSTLIFPKVYQVSELKTTGFALVNPGPADATAQVSLYKPDTIEGCINPCVFEGEVISRSTLVVPSKGQLSKLGSELFPDAAGHGWVEIKSTSPGLQGFWMGGDFATNADGADPARAGEDLIFPLLTAKTEINVTNLIGQIFGTNLITRFRLFGADGKETASTTQLIRPRGAYQGHVADLFPNADLSAGSYIRVTAQTPIAGTEVVKGFLVDTETAVLNAFDSSLTSNTLNFVHAVSGPLEGSDYTTTVGVINLSSGDQNVTITFHPEPNGKPTVATRLVPANGALQETAKSLFGFSSFQNGWIQVSGSGALTGFVVYADTISGGLAAVPLQTQPLTAMLLDQIAGPPTWYTGIGLLNASTTDANVEVYALTPGGTLIGGAQDVPTAAFTLQAGRKVAKLLSEIIPDAASQNGGFIYIRTTNSVPIYGIELFGGNVLPILSNVAASALSSVFYTPPNRSAPLQLISVAPARSGRGSTVMLNGANFGYPASANSVVFTAITGTVTVTPLTASLNTLTVTVPPTAITGPVFVQSSGKTSPNVVLEVTAGDSSVLQNAVTVNEGQVTDNADIYVPRAAGIKILAIGESSLGSRSLFVEPYTVDLPRGQSRTLAIVGLQIGLSLGTTVSISGSGVTVFGLQEFQNSVLFDVTVDSNAEPGPRSVFVTNPNFDVSSIPGGVYIR